MPVLYGSADDVRHAAAVSLGYVPDAGAWKGSSGSGLASAAPGNRTIDDAPLPVPTMPDASTVDEAKRRLQSILASVIAEESDRKP